MRFAALATLLATPVSASPLLNLWDAPWPNNSLAMAQNAPTSYISVNGVRIAYRRFGKQSELPLVYTTHFLGSMDTNDPMLLNLLARDQEVIIFDNAGVGHSEGTIPNTVSSMAGTAVDFLTAIGVPKANFMGFSLGGMISQYIAIEHSQLVNKIVLSGTQSGVGPGTSIANLTELAEGNPSRGPDQGVFLLRFFSSSNSSQEAGRMWWQRIHERQIEGEERKEFVTAPGDAAQFQAIVDFVSDANFFNRLSAIQGPVLITSGRTDKVTPTVNSFAMQQKLSNALLVLYPNSGHGHLYQFAEDVVSQVRNFLR